MNILGIENSSNLISKQAVLKDIELVLALQNATTEDEVVEIVNGKLQEFFEEVGKPLFKPIYPNTGGLPLAEHYNHNCSYIYNDISLISSELKELAQNITAHFNYRQTKKNNIKSKLNYLSALCSDYALTANLDEPNINYVSEHFNTLERIAQKVTTPEALAYVDTRVGVLTLQRVNSYDRSTDTNTKVTLINSSKGSMAGNYHLIKSDKDTISYLSDNGAYDDPSKVLDGNPNTWFEYQLVNLPDNVKNTWKSDLSWANGTKSDLLTVTLLIELSEIVDINWININPYIPTDSGKVIVKLIETSSNGTNYEELYKDRLVLNSQLNSTAQTYRLEDIVSDIYDIPKKFIGQGVWSFNSRPAKFIKIVLEQDKYYNANLGHNKYEEVIVDSNGNIKSRVIQNEANIATAIRNGSVGQYPITGTSDYIEKSIEVAQGWRYCIGIKDVGINSYKYAQRSEIITLPYEFTKAIKEVALYTTEYIPKDFLDEFSKINAWITYEISLDGNTFYPISPMHRNPIGKGIEKTATGLATTFPPKIYEVNPTNSYEVQQRLFYKGYIDNQGQPAYSIQLKITINRPAEAEFATPVLDNFTLKIVTEEV